MDPEDIEDELQEQFVYPRNKRLRDTYIALLGRVRTDKKIRLSIFEAVEAICDRKGWTIDHTPGSQKSPGPHVKRAKQMLRQLEGKFFQFHGAAIIEVVAFNIATKRRVTSFDELFDLCDNDRYLSEFSDLDDTLIWDEWEDPHKIMFAEEEMRIDQEVSDEVLVLSNSNIVRVEDDNISSSIEGFRQSEEDYLRELLNSNALKG